MLDWILFHGLVGQLDPQMLGTLSSKLQQPTRFLLMAAPLEEHSNYAFRRLCHSYGADLTFTEMVYTKSIIRNNKPTLQRLDLQLPAVPTQIQLLVSNSEDLRRYLSTFTPPPGTLNCLSIWTSQQVLRDLIWTWVVPVQTWSKQDWVALPLNESAKPSKL